MRAFILAILIATSAFAEEFTVEGVNVVRPLEAKQFGICEHYSVTPKEAKLFFLSARSTNYQDENLIIGPCKVFGSIANESNSKWEIYIGGAGVIYRVGADPKWFYCGEKCCSTVGRKVCG